MSLKPWREIARPHRDVLNFKQSEFAADITQVAGGKAEPEYQDTEQFFARTYITEGMRLLSVAQRLAGRGGEAVIQLQTAFGGGKTHTLYHFASRTVEASRGIPPILDEVENLGMPHARVAVIDGIDLAPSRPRQHGACIAANTPNTLWGELAWRLQEGYQIVAQSDAEGTSPGKEVLSALLRKAAPCAILALVAFIRQLEPGRQFPAGTFDSNISFIQALTEAIKAVPNAVLLASLPESKLEAGGTTGQHALEALEKCFA